MTLILASGNPHKRKEIQAMLAMPARVLSLQDFSNAPQPIEDAPTLEGNAIKKAISLGRWLHEMSPCNADFEPNENTWVLADDSGLEVDALDGAPGVHSARYASLEDAGVAASGNAPDEENNAKLLRLMRDIPVDLRGARFRCVLALTKLSESNFTPASAQVFHGVCTGHIAVAPSGDAGFGYDPLFIPDGYHQSFAELGEDIKNQISHRSQALRQMVAFLRNWNTAGESVDTGRPPGSRIDQQPPI